MSATAMYGAGDRRRYIEDHLLAVVHGISFTASIEVGHVS